MLKARVATATILLGVFLCAVFFLPTRQFAILIGAVVAAGAFEWAAMTGFRRPNRYAFSAACTALFGLVIWVLQAIDPARPGVAWIYAVSALFWVLVVPVWLVKGVRFVSTRLALPVGLLVIVPAGLAIVSLHTVGAGVLVLLIALVWIADTAAYFAGRAFGRHKLAPSISPGKTWEGVAGALAATLAYASVSALAIPQLSATVQGADWIAYLAGAAVLCVLSILGDLFESSAKRQADVKDSGTLLPGHGGVLDRIDSITSALPVAALLFYFIAGGTP